MGKRPKKDVFELISLVFTFVLFEKRLLCTAHPILKIDGSPAKPRALPGVFLLSTIGLELWCFSMRTAKMIEEGYWRLDFSAQEIKKRRNDASTNKIVGDLRNELFWFAGLAQRWKEWFDATSIELFAFILKAAFRLSE